jgi:hypothetical protein
MGNPVAMVPKARTGATAARVAREATAGAVIPAMGEMAATAVMEAEWTSASLRALSV